jgi:hypothetical protein
MNDSEIRNRYGVGKKHATFMAIQMLFVILGTVLTIALIIRQFQTGVDSLNLAANIVTLISYLAIIIYASVGFKKKGQVFFNAAIYSYALVFAFQILMFGNMIASSALSPSLAVFINICNLAAFTCVIKFADKQDNKVLAIGYIVCAIIIKLVGEIVLNVAYGGGFQLLYVLMSLANPILGMTLLSAYLARLIKSGK